ncbi:hypothetical protein PINS_up001231 [Pythium insidiosum]|nr:hypothetical protein PINS_up001231 [Pythium insidiosum]
MATSAALSGAMDADYIEMMHHRAMHQVNEVLHVCLHTPRTQDRWHCLQRDKHLELYAKKSNTTRSVFFLGVNEIYCGFDEVHDLLSFDNRKQFHLVMKLLYGRNFRDGDLAALRHPRACDVSYDVADVQHSALWMSMQARRDSVMGRDNRLEFFQALMILHPDRSTIGSSTLGAGGLQSLYARPSDTIKKRTLALTWLPFVMDDDAMASSATSMSDALRLQYTLIVEEVSRNRLRLACVSTSFRDGDDLHGRSSAARQIARRLVARSISKLDGAVVAARLSKQTLVAPNQWVRNEDRASCVICWKSFNSFFRRRHHCRLCGEVICGSCSTLRRTNIVLRKDFEKVRICHLCSNRGRKKSDSFASTSFASHVPPQHVDGSDDGGLEHYTIGTQRRTPGRPRFIENIHRYQRPIGLTEEMDIGDDDDDDDFDESDGYLGEYVSARGIFSSQKIISIRSLTRSEGVASSTSSAATTGSVWDPPSIPRVFRRTNTTPATLLARAERQGDKMQPPAGYASAPKESTKAPVQTGGDSFSQSFLHPLAQAAAAQRAEPPKSIVADVGSYDMYASLGADISTIKTPDDVPEIYRRTSMLSLGLMDGYEPTDADTGASLPANTTPPPPTGARKAVTYADAAWEARRLKLMKVICSPACTLVDRALMRECCEAVAAAFHVRCAFIARVEELFVVLEHVVGTHRLSPIDHFLRAETPCDLVLARSGHPLVVMNCHLDSRTKDLEMVRDLDMRFLVGASIRVRGLPIASICAFSMGPSSDDDDQDASPAPSVVPSVTNVGLKTLQRAAQFIEEELERFVDGLDI